MLPSLAEKEILGPMDGGEGPEGDQHEEGPREALGRDGACDDLDPILRVCGLLCLGNDGDLSWQASWISLDSV